MLCWKEDEVSPKTFVDWFMIFDLVQRIFATLLKSLKLCTDVKKLFNERYLRNSLLFFNLMSAKSMGGSWQVTCLIDTGDWGWRRSRVGVLKVKSGIDWAGDRWLHCREFHLENVDMCSMFCTRCYQNFKQRSRTQWQKSNVNNRTKHCS